MKKRLKKLYIYGELSYRFAHQTQAFKNRYKNINRKLFEKNVDKKLIKKYKRKWGNISPFVETETLELCHNISNRIDLNIIPENIFAAIVEPLLNPYKDKQLSFLSVKNIYSKWFNNPEIFPSTYFHKVDNIYYDANFNVIDDLNIFLADSLNKLKFPLICKPSIGTSGGEGVKVLYNLESIKENIDSYPNLVFQELIIQSDLLQDIYPSMNSIRTCLYRTKSGRFKVINNSIRFGVNGSLDNETAGGIVCNIESNGVLNDYAVSKYCEKYFRHPNTEVEFSEVTIPNYDELFICAENIANQIPLCNLVSLDMCLDNEGNWRCLEINLDAQTIRFRQYAGYAFFGEYTDEVIERVLETKIN